MAEVNSANSANPTPNAGPAEPAPAGNAPGRDARKLAAVPEQKGSGRPPGRADEPRRRGVSRGVFALVAALLVLSLLGLYAQSRQVAARDAQITRLADQVDGLQAQLAAANTQIATYDMQRALVKTSVADLMEKITALSDLVSSDPLAPTLPPAPALSAEPSASSESAASPESAPEATVTPETGTSPESVTSPTTEVP